MTSFLKSLCKREYFSECRSEQSVLTADSAVTLIALSLLTLRSLYSGALQSLIMRLICFPSDLHWFGSTDLPASSRTTVRSLHWKDTPVYQTSNLVRTTVRFVCGCCPIMRNTQRGNSLTYHASTCSVADVTQSAACENFLVWREIL